MRNIAMFSRCAASTTFPFSLLKSYGSSMWVSMRGLNASTVFISAMHTKNAPLYTNVNFRSFLSQVRSLCVLYLHNLKVSFFSKRYSKRADMSFCTLNPSTVLSSKDIMKSKSADPILLLQPNTWPSQYTLAVLNSPFPW